MPNSKLLCMKNPFILVKAEKQTVDGVIQTLEGKASYKVGDFIVTGIVNEQWPVKPDKNNKHVPNGYSSTDCCENIFWPSGKVFKNYEIAKEAGKIKPSWDIEGQTILDYDFGDYLIEYGEGDITPCKKEIFEKTYMLGNSGAEIVEKISALSFKEIQQMNEKITVDNNPNIAVPTNLEWKEEEKIKVIKKSVSKNIGFKNSKERTELDDKMIPKNIEEQINKLNQDANNYLYLSPEKEKLEDLKKSCDKTRKDLTDYETKKRIIKPLSSMNWERNRNQEIETSTTNLSNFIDKIW
ncbi:hypothetical protein [Spiroplasma endosymbiont of Nebria brevicollis]|uniref:hypothetical protein n=1 Tax=Spiroplasma endosymbiont of Nebria brevicollis TaxID=3066284 RepID=UPI00313BF8F6